MWTHLKYDWMGRVIREINTLAVLRRSVGVGGVGVFRQVPQAIRKLHDKKSIKRS